MVRCVSVHPGEVLTDVVRSLPGAMQRMYKLVMRMFLLDGGTRYDACLMA